MDRVLVNCHHDNHRRRCWWERPTEHLPELPADDVTGQVDDADAVRRAAGGGPGDGGRPA